jgi:3-hydroxyisobutyrate dehydrogenase-like beta-hydroxyacid dehydrogenase
VTFRDIRTVGVVGLGAIGGPIAQNIARGGFKVIGFDANPVIRTSLALTISMADSAADLARQCELVIVVVGHERDVEAVLFDDRGVVSGARDGTIIVISSTVAPRNMERIGTRAKDTQVHLLDAPVARGEDAAVAGRLFAFVGGEKEVVAAAWPVIATFADTIHHLGGIGAGQIGKIVNSLIFWACISANYEAMKLGQAFGVDLRALRAAVLESSGQNWALSTNAGEKPAPTAERDMMIILQEADDLRLSLPLAGVVKEVIKGIKIERSGAMGGG